MKMTSKQMKKLSAIYHDYMCIENDVDLKKRKLSLCDYHAFPVIFTEIQSNGSTETFISNIANYFKKYGFTVAEKSANYCISI